MDYKDINNALLELTSAFDNLEFLYIEGDGEVTEETERIEAQISRLRDLLTTEGVDFLGGWLKAKEDRKKALKAENAYITRKMAAIDDTIEFIKGKISEVMLATGQDKLVGSRGYSFKAADSVKTEVDKDTLNENYSDKVEAAIRAANVPAYIGVTLTASSTKADEVGVVAGDEGLFLRTVKQTVRFTKPRASKEA